MSYVGKERQKDERSKKFYGPTAVALCGLINARANAIPLQVFSKYYIVNVYCM
jgi:hypothetical protein